MLKTKTLIRIFAFAASVVLFLGFSRPLAFAQGQPTGAGRAGQATGGGRAAAPAPDPSKPHRIEITEAKARYKVQEQLLGVDFPSEAVGSTEAVTGVVVVNPDGSINSAQSKLTVDLKTLKSDQQLRDGYVQTRVLESDKFPTLEFVPKRAVGIPVPLPAGGQSQAGFQLVGDMTLHGVTSEATWNVITTLGNDQVAGRATTTVLFTTFKMAKPSLARLLGVDDKIQLEVEFKCKRSVVM